MANRQNLEQAAHPVGFGQPPGRVDQCQCTDGGLATRQPVGSLEQAKPCQEFSLCQRPVYRGAHGCAGKGGKIPMRGQIGRAGLGQRVRWLAIA